MLPSFSERFRNLQRKVGFAGALQYALRRLLTRGLSIDVLANYDHVISRPFGDPAAAQSVSPKTINWLVPDFGVGSGGHLNIFRLIRMLEEHGFKNTVHIVGHTHFKSSEEAKATTSKHFGEMRSDVLVGHECLRPAHFTIATSWPTAYVLRDFCATREKLYFVQDYEPDFYPRGTDYWLARATYDMGFKAITAGGWLAAKLKLEHEMETHAMGFSYDSELYHKGPTRQPTKRVFFYARPPTARRAFELGLLAMQIVGRARPDVTFVLAGWDLNGANLPFRNETLGNVPVARLPSIYQDCDLALVLSATNLSLLPLELMSCGCPVVSNRGPNVEWLLNDQNSVLCEPTPTALAIGMTKLLENEDRRLELANAGLNFAQSTSWQAEGLKVARVLDSMAVTA